jgi:DNA-binding transcriptional regulator YiaG
MKALKEEIARIARSEVNNALKPIKSVNASQRKYIADLRRQVAQLEKDNKQLARQLDKTAAALPEEEAAPAAKTTGWITAQGVRATRKRLKLSKKDFATLAGVSLPTVSSWEAQKKGKLNIRRKAVLARLQQIKSMGLREVQAELAGE